ncbi:MAG TPA: hypothetical protein VMS76_19285, partial [Planctomycetota bacterium]|nr:hypothetical protein [Planctomycetota bacterium]
TPTPDQSAPGHFSQPGKITSKEQLGIPTRDTHTSLSITHKIQPETPESNSTGSRKAAEGT